MASRSYLRTARIFICTAYVLVPAILGIIGALGLFTQGFGTPTSPGLLGAALIGIMPGIPLALFQLFAVLRHSSQSARIISWAYWAFLILLLFGAFQLAVVGSDDVPPFRPVPDGVILIIFLLLNLMTALTMGQLAHDFDTTRQE